MKYTKNNYKKMIKLLTYNDLMKEYNELSLMKLKIMRTISLNNNPHQDKLPPKIINWKYCQVVQLLHNMNKNGNEKS